MNKKILLAFFALLISVILISGCPSVNQPREYKEPSDEPVFAQQQPIQECDSKQGLEKDYCLIEFARNEIVCSAIEIKNKDLGEVCRVVVVGDYSKCDDVKLNYTCYLITARKTKNPDFCEKIGDANALGLKGDCYEIMSQFIDRPELCEKIGSPYSQGLCYMAGAQRGLFGSAECAKISDNLTKDLCYLYVVKNTQDKSYCNKIEDQHRKESCNRWDLTE